MKNLKRINQILKSGIVCGILSINLLNISCGNNKDESKSIEISTSGCYKNCPILDLSFNGNEIFYQEIKYSEKKGVYVYYPSKEELIKINNLLSSLQIDSLKEEYISYRNDMQVYNTSIKVGDYKKNVLFYEGESPDNYEKFIIYLIDLGQKASEKKDITLKVNTREKVKILNVPTPPKPGDE